MMKNILILAIAVLSACSQSAEEHKNKGNAKAELNDYKGAIPDYTKVIELDPNNDGAYLNRGKAKFYLQDYKGAIADCNKAIEVNNPVMTLKGFNNIVEAYIMRGGAKFYLQDYKGAIADCNKVILVEPNHAKAYYLKGVAKITSGQKNSGCLDLCKAGELGFGEAYDVIKNMCN